jgi:hypothetical protein
MLRMESEPEFACLMREAQRVDRLFRLSLPLDGRTRAEIALHEWVREGRRLSLSFARRAKRAILNVGVYAVIHGLADAWCGVKRRPIGASPSTTVIAG